MESGGIEMQKEQIATDVEMEDKSPKPEMAEAVVSTEASSGMASLNKSIMAANEYQKRADRPATFVSRTFRSPADILPDLDKKEISRQTKDRLIGRHFAESVKDSWGNEGRPEYRPNVQPFDRASSGGDEAAMKPIPNAGDLSKNPKNRDLEIVGEAPKSSGDHSRLAEAPDARPVDALRPDGRGPRPVDAQKPGADGSRPEDSPKPGADPRPIDAPKPGADARPAEPVPKPGADPRPIDAPKPNAGSDEIRELERKFADEIAKTGRIPEELKKILSNPGSDPNGLSIDRLNQLLAERNCPYRLSDRYRPILPNADADVREVSLVGPDGNKVDSYLPDAHRTDKPRAERDAPLPGSRERGSLTPAEAKALEDECVNTIIRNPQDYEGNLQKRLEGLPKAQRATVIENINRRLKEAGSPAQLEDDGKEPGDQAEKDLEARAKLERELADKIIANGGKIPQELLDMFSGKGDPNGIKVRIDEINLMLAASGSKMRLSQQKSQEGHDTLEVKEGDEVREKWVFIKSKEYGILPHKLVSNPKPFDLGGLKDEPWPGFPKPLPEPIDPGFRPIDLEPYPGNGFPIVDPGHDRGWAPEPKREPKELTDEEWKAIIKSLVDDRPAPGREVYSSVMAFMRALEAPTVRSVVQDQMQKLFEDAKKKEKND